ncbi:conserved protein of unknown function [Candidatus Filomicrobium marinum]|uniref:Uncharacterized protein n=1 Tax=Candidatus Filomicrobium marinum TaxID=1608628 RepID=A0A0D6JFG5_9HYPH|nr:conserved protein of unknown function [Candidatus Filomicrobium marinum]CPR19493.1 conserved protein of unknown function [Candidatus Filomicrobium marinum]
MAAEVTAVVAGATVEEVTEAAATWVAADMAATLAARMFRMEACGTEVAVTTGMAATVGAVPIGMAVP